MLRLRWSTDCARPVQFAADNRIDRSTAQGVCASPDVLAA
ncbi:MAG: hypothetical protein JWP46_1916, partial [Modestobacter sp.]|nr:hypothetical protein [Modestobacter sp.]